MEGKTQPPRRERDAKKGSADISKSHLIFRVGAFDRRLQFFDAQLEIDVTRPQLLHLQIIEHVICHRTPKQWARR
jgi:hypothetical protein